MSQGCGHGHKTQLCQLSHLSHFLAAQHIALTSVLQPGTTTPPEIEYTSFMPKQDAAWWQSIHLRGQRSILIVFAISQASRQNNTSQSLWTPAAVQFTVAFKGQTTSGTTGSPACGEADVRLTYSIARSSAHALGHEGYGSKTETLPGKVLGSPPLSTPREQI